MTCEPPPRPKANDEAIRDRAAALFAPELERWANGELSRSQIEQDLVAIRYWPYDGYEFARELERRYYWDPDQDLVEILGRARSQLDNALSEAEKAWVSAHSIEPRFSVGQRCQCSRISTGIKVGAISGVRRDVGKYLFIPDDEVEKFKGGGGWIVNYEDVAPISSQAAVPS